MVKYTYKESGVEVAWNYGFRAGINLRDYLTQLSHFRDKENETHIEVAFQGHTHSVKES